MSKASNAAAAAAVTAETAATAVIAPAPGVEGPPASPATANVELGVLRQVPMTVQVEVGRTSMTLGEILDELEVGASIRLDRHAGDPVEVYVNGALFARAEVVILQDQIGARILEIVASGQDMRPSGLR
jgi:flagellar motor switch protein FliN/FliY